MGTRITSSNYKVKVSSSVTVCPRRTKLGGYLLAPANDNKGFATDGNFHLQAEATIDSDLDDMIALGAGWVRLSVDWSQVQAAGVSSFNWTADYAITSAISKGLKVLAAILFTPSFARLPGGNGDYKDAPVAAKYATFCGQAVTHYKALGVRHYEIWNEPNIPGFWYPVDAAHYTDCIQAAYPVMKAADPYCTVITGGLAPAPDSGGSVNPRTFLSSIYSEGGQGYFDGVGMHPYTQPSFPGQTEDWNPWYHMVQMRSTMVAQGDSAKRIWATESGAPTDGDPLAPENFVDEATQAEIIGTGFEVWSSYSWGGDGGDGAPLFVYMHRDLGTAQTTEQNFFGVRDNAGVVKPSASNFTSETYP